MRIGIISDIHGNSVALKAVLDDLDYHGVEKILIAGDFVGYYPDVNEVFSLLKSRETITVKGNHDCYLLKEIAISEERFKSYNLKHVDDVILDANREWLSNIPLMRRFELDGVHFMLCHGSPWSTEEYIYPDHTKFKRFADFVADVIVMGHTHIPLIKKVNDVLLINPGSCGQPRDYNPLAAYAILETRDMQVEIMRTFYDMDTFCARLVNKGFDHKLVEILRRT